MSSEWPLRTVAECASSEPYATQMGPFGDKIRAETYVQDGLPVLRGLNCSDGFSRFHDDDFVFVPVEKVEDYAPYVAASDDVVIVHKGTIGKVGIIPRKTRYPSYVVGNSLIRVRCDKSKLLPHFLYYWFSSKFGRAFLESRLSTVGVPQVQRPLSTIREATFRCPPIDEQERIVETLTAFDNGIETATRVSRSLEEVSRALFRSWFVDFDPVRAKIEGRPTGLPHDVAALFPDRLVESPLGMVPVGWPVVPLPDVLEFNPPRRIEKGAIAPYLEMAEMPTEGHRPYGWRQRKVGSGSRFVNGDTLLARITGCIEHGKTALVDFLGVGEVGWGSTEYIVMRPYPPLPPFYAYFLARDDAFRSFAIANMNGSSGRQRVPIACFDNYRVARPPDALAAAWGSIVEPLMVRVAKNDEQSRTLVQLRNALLPKLLSGEIRVPLEADAHLTLKGGG